MRTKARDRQATPFVTRLGHKARPMTGEQVRDTTFLITRWGYDVAAVDNLLCSIAADLGFEVTLCRIPGPDPDRTSQPA